MISQAESQTITNPGKPTHLRVDGRWKKGSMTIAEDHQSLYNLMEARLKFHLQLKYSHVPCCIQVNMDDILFLGMRGGMQESPL